MQYIKVLLTGFLCLHFFSVLSQEPSPRAIITGHVKQPSGQPVPFATVKVQNSTAGALSDIKGVYTLPALPAGEYTITVTALGFETQEKKIRLQGGANTTLHFQLAPAARDIDEVMVIGRTATQEVNRQSYNVTAIDATKLYNSTLDLSHALDRVSGVRVRENGGLGSRINFSLNGFTGRQVRFFIDGIPMDNFGSSFQLNNIPINLAERVEVYKGVVPVWLGSDALGGAVNIVTGQQLRTYLDVSYSYGSFNTHRSAINAGYTAKSGFTLQLNAFQNYSDNNYPVYVDVADINTGAYYPSQKVRRFHDTYHNETVIANVGVVNKKYADKLLLGITLGQNHADVQTGARMVSVFGKFYTRGNIVMPSLKYAKNNLFVKGLNLRVSGNYNLGEEQNVDTVYRRYNWFQQYKTYNGLGGERERTLYKYRNNNGLLTSTLDYKLNDHHSFMLNHVFNTFDRKGADELYPQSAKYEQPQKLTKNILGLGYKFDYNNRWSTSLFGKYFMQGTKYSQSYNPSGNWGDIAYRHQQNKFSKTGYGISSSYFITPRLQFKGSYERSFRLPDTYELFGDLLNLEGNIQLRPEKSDNYNVGASYSFRLQGDHRFSLDGNFIYRNTADFIRASLNQNQTKQVMENRDRVTNTGFDGEIRYSYKKLLTAGVNATYQNIRNKTRFEPGSSEHSILYNDRIPNMPFLYGNGDASLFLPGVFGKGNTLSLGYNVLFVHAYYLYWPSLGNDKLDIPQQLTHDVNATYAMAEGRYNIALECKNLADARLYDNFSLQKPGRAFYVKLRYFFKK
ncbi:TonB-dependent receptor [Chitinophaga alhagiae]|uniref:TonB-dependent receptor n=1 Tax=Chitinophaga alhagiae TaxID=2203219 RepID=A0ABN5LRR4_9BACT|nr:TonB-dependent receptor [Chitinophaga alhagiae]AWO02073.1 TonB-dependent receptor [Chitinophaga alhagiae]